MEASMDPVFITGINTFAANLFAQVSRSLIGENLFISPFSVSTCLAMVMLGSRNNTRNQLFTRLSGRNDSTGFTDEDYTKMHQGFQSLLTNLDSSRSSQASTQVSLLLSNMLLIQKNMPESDPMILSKFKEEVSSLYHASVNDVDFPSEGPSIVNMTNDWVNKSTNGLIKEFLDTPPDLLTRLILLNAIYFKGKWQLPFDTHLSGEDNFTQWDGSKVKTTMMRMYDVDEFKYVKGTLGGEAVHIIDLPYDEKNVFTLVVPEAVDGLKKAMTSVSDPSDFGEQVKSLLALEKNRRSNVHLFLPKFKMEKDLPLDDLLQSLGMTDMYSAGTSDLSGINGITGDLYVSAAKHKAVVEVNEEGTEAAAVTGIMMKTLAFIQPTEIKADRPFLFFIRGGTSSKDSERVVLFSGLYAKVP